MKKTLLAILLAAALIVIPVGSALAADSAEVTVTATPGWVSIVCAPNTYGFNVVTVGSVNQTSVDYFTITNSSTVNMDVNIGCDGWTGTVNSWTYGASGIDDQAQLLASDGDGAYDVTVPSAGSTQLMDAVLTTTSPTWELELEEPTGFTFVDVQSTTILLTAVPD